MKIPFLYIPGAAGGNMLRTASELCSLHRSVVIAIHIAVLLLLGNVSVMAQHGRGHKRPYHRERLPDSISTITSGEVSSGEAPAGIKDAAEPSPPVATDSVKVDTAVMPAGVASGDSSSAASGGTEDSVRPDPVTLRTVPDTAVARYKKDPDFAYANDPAYWTGEKERNNENTNDRGAWLERFLRSDAFKYTVYILLAGILLYAIYRIIRDNNLGVFVRPSRQTVYSVPGADLPQEDLEGKLKEALQNMDYRLAVRYLYLKTIRLSGEKGIIRVHDQATNREYIRQAGAFPVGRDFEFLTMAYDRVWYGGVVPDKGQFERLNGHFQDLFQKLK